MTAIRGVVFQSDGRSTIGRLIIRPLEGIDRWIVGVLRSPHQPSLAMHAGIHVVIDGHREFVAEQLAGGPYLTFHKGLRWTPIEQFRLRDRGGWDVTVSAVYFRHIDEAGVQATIPRLNAIEGYPFVKEDCTAFIERAFGGCRMFADSPLLRALGIRARIGDPALPLLRPDAQVDPAEKLQFDIIKHLPDAEVEAGSPNARAWLVRHALALALGAAVGLAAERYSSSSRRSTPVSSTARKFFR